MSSHEVVLKRDCEATRIPFGGVELLAAGAQLRILQSLGGTYTVANDRGEMLRIESKDADALGFEAQQPASPQSAEFSEALVWNTLKTVYDPEIPVNVVDLGLIYACRITSLETGHKIEVEMSLTAPGCGIGDVLKADIERRLSQLPEVGEVSINIVFDPPWHPGLMSQAAKLQLGLDVEAGSSARMY